MESGKKKKKKEKRRMKGKREVVLKWEGQGRAVFAVTRAIPSQADKYIHSVLLGTTIMIIRDILLDQLLMGPILDRYLLSLDISTLNCLLLL